MTELTKTEGFVWPHSIQTDLFNYLKEEQKEFIKPILRTLKKPAQEELCCALLDYLEQGRVMPPVDIAIGGIFYYCIQKLNPVNHTEPKTISSIFKQMSKQ